MNLRHLVGNGQQCRHGAEGHPAEVHVEAGNDDPYAPAGKLVAHLGQPFVEKLGLVDTQISDDSSSIDSDDSMGVEGMVLRSWLTTSPSE